MSLVERTLKKLQDAKSADASRLAQSATPLARTQADTDRDSGAPKPERQLVPVESTHIVKVDREELRRIDLLPPPDMERRIASQYQQIKRALVSRILNSTPGLGPLGHVVMLASALPGDGKTFTSINLALSLALEKDIEVLLVDADVAKPHVSRIFGIEQERGLLDLLLDKSLRASQVILRTDVPGLSLLPAGSRTESATELIASDRMTEIVSQLSAPGGRRIVLFDSPPLLLSTESCALAASAGQVVLVVRADVTSRQAVSNAIEAIGGKPVSLILNQANTQPADGYYGYGSYGDAAKA